MSAATRRIECNGETVLFMAIEVSDKAWKVGDDGFAGAEGTNEERTRG